jgi:hypothetical protein
MAACPWCKAAVPDASVPCPRCGRRVDEQSPAAGAADVPELVMPVRRASKGSMPQVVVPPAGAQAQAQPAAPVAAKREKPAALHNAFEDPGARSFDEEEDVYGGGAPIDLDLSQGPPMISAQAPAAAAGRPSVGRLSAGKLSAAQPAGSAGAGAELGAPNTQGAAAMDRRAAEATIDPFEARALSDYGEPPEQWWKTPLYAYRVLRRRPELRKRAAAKKREGDRAQGAAEDALLAYAELVRPVAQKLAAYGAAFAEVRQTEAVVRERDAVLAAEADAHKARQAEHDAKIAEMDAQLSQIQVEERQIAGEYGEADTLAKRAEARAKRAEIETRNAIAQAGGDAPADPRGPA